MKNLKIIGLGGRSTQFYVQYFNELYLKKHGGYATCPFTLINIDFNEINPFLPDDFTELAPKMKLILKQFDNKSDIIVIPNITLHETTDLLPFNNIIHPVRAIILKLKKLKIDHITLVGSYYTSYSKKVIEQFDAAHIKVSVLAETDINLIDKVRSNVYNNDESNAHIQEFNTLLHKYNKQAAVVTACTELSIVIDQVFFELDLARTQIERAFDLTFTNN